MKDSIDVTSYKDISGLYQGSITKIRFVAPDAYVTTGPSKIHNVEISEIDFDKVLVQGISDEIESDAEAEMFRYNQAGGYLRFLSYSMTDSTGIDSVFNAQFNGRYEYSDRSLTYFIFYVENSDTIHQVFEGKIK